jgi:sterol 14-demethylase
MTDLIARIVAERRASGTEVEDFLDTLMGARYPDGRTLEEEEITGLLLATVFAGQHTSAVLATWTGALLLEHEAHLAAVRAEQDAVFGSGREMTVETLRQLSVLERCIKEAERMHPPLTLLMRRVLRELVVGDHVVPAGDIALVSPAAAHRLPEVFPDSDRYDPDRFAPGRQEDRKHRHALIGFGGGHHRCIGSTFAYQQVKAIWSVLLRRFELSLVRRGHVPDYSTFVPGPRGPCLVRYRRRRRGAGAPTPVATGGGAQP